MSAGAVGSASDYVGERGLSASRRPRPSVLQRSRCPWQRSSGASLSENNSPAKLGVFRSLCVPREAILARGFLAERRTYVQAGLLSAAPATPPARCRPPLPRGAGGSILWPTLLRWFSLTWHNLHQEAAGPWRCPASLSCWPPLQQASQRLWLPTRVLPAASFEPCCSVRAGHLELGWEGGGAGGGAQEPPWYLGLALHPPGDGRSQK